MMVYPKLEGCCYCFQAGVNTVWSNYSDPKKKFCEKGLTEMSCSFSLRSWIRIPAGRKEVCQPRFLHSSSLLLRSIDQIQLDSHGIQEKREKGKEGCKTKHPAHLTGFTGVYAAQLLLAA